MSEWNPVTGCTLHPERLDQPLRWRKPRRIFVNSLSDLFHNDVPDEYIARVFAVMALAPQHTFLVLTKRHARMRALLGSVSFRNLFDAETDQVVSDAASTGALPRHRVTEIRDRWWRSPWPLPNVWVGVTVEDQHAADVRIPALLDTPAAVRFLSCEPLLAPVDLRLGEHVGEDCRGCSGLLSPAHEPGNHWEPGEWSDIDWVICGGESGPDARPMHPDWARSLRDQCQAAGVPFLFKQRGEWSWNEPGEFRVPQKPLSDRVAVMHPAGMVAMTKANPFDPFERGNWVNWMTRIERVGKRAAGRELDGQTWDQYPGGVRPGHITD